MWLVGVVSGCGWQEVGVANKVKSMDDNCGVGGMYGCG